MAIAAAPPASAGERGMVAEAPSPAPSPRLAALDRLRGVIMVLMALDHTRAFLWTWAYSPVDLAHTTPAMFATRWITHLCAPVFVFFAGTAAWLARGRGKDGAALRRFLWTRGAWLIVLELTIVKLGWEGTQLEPTRYGVQVIWALGWSMLALAAVAHLPRGVIAALGLVLVAGPNALDPVVPADLGPLDWLWIVLHEGGTIGAAAGDGWALMVKYPLLPWVGAMLLGYAFGGVLTSPRWRDDRRARIRLFLAIGLGALAVFAVLRGPDLYGEPSPWRVQDGALFTALSFVNLTKYPPSLLFLLCTLGLSFLLLAAFERWDGRLAEVARTFGRVPLFFYLIHLPLLFVAMAITFRLDLGRWPDGRWDGFGFELPVIYGAWLALIAALYLPCRWFAALKARRRDWWLGYL